MHIPIAGLALIRVLLVLMNMGLILVNRSSGAPLALAVSWRPAQELFRFGQLHWNDPGICAIASVSSLIALEAVKSAGSKSSRGIDW